jgi:hypothetical protein
MTSQTGNDIIVRFFDIDLFLMFIMDFLLSIHLLTVTRIFRSFIMTKCRFSAAWGV